jgi:hypothetical protein
VARQTKRLLVERDVLCEPGSLPTAPQLYTTGHSHELQEAAMRWLGLDTLVEAVDIQ